MKKAATARTAVAKKTSSGPKRIVAIKKAMTKSELLNAIAEDVELSRKEVAAVLESLNHKAHCHLKGVGEFTVPGLLKIRVMRKPATKARKGINPFTGEETTFKAKPARNIPKFRALKALKEMVVK
ncbi:MAG: HU family DNA-binding protein [Gammaproteobacteria bacterium]